MCVRYTEKQLRTHTGMKCIFNFSFILSFFVYFCIWFFASSFSNIFFLSIRFVFVLFYFFRCRKTESLIQKTEKCHCMHAFAVYAIGSNRWLYIRIWCEIFGLLFIVCWQHSRPVDVFVCVFAFFECVCSTAQLLYEFDKLDFWNSFGKSVWVYLFVGFSSVFIHIFGVSWMRLVRIYAAKYTKQGSSSSLF